MPKRSSKHYDANATAFSIVQQASREPSSAIVDTLDNAELRKRLMQEMGRRGGKKGGKARAAMLSSEQKTAIARKAAIARWGTK